jgi:hypothetical protein
LAFARFPGYGVVMTTTPRRLAGRLAPLAILAVLALTMPSSPAGISLAVPVADLAAAPVHVAPAVHDGVAPAQVVGLQLRPAVVPGHGRDLRAGAGLLEIAGFLVCALWLVVSPPGRSTHPRVLRFPLRLRAPPRTA